MSVITDRIALLPWVTRLAETVPCQAYRYAHMPGKALWDSKGQAADPALKKKYRCRNRARWQFRGLPDQLFPARDGTYCWSHLLVQLYSMAEEDRTRRGLARIREQEQGSIRDFA